MKLNDKANANEVIVTVLLIVFAFGFYYLWLFPRLVSEYESKFWHTPTSSVERRVSGICSQESGGGIGTLNFKLTFPKYIANFIDRDISLKIDNNTGQHQRGLLLINSQLVMKEDLTPIKNSVIDLIVDDEYKEYLEFDLPSCAAQTYIIRSNVPWYDPEQQLYAQFRFDIGEVDDIGDSASIEKTLVWDLVSKTCVPTAIDVEDDGDILCAEVNPDQVLLHTAIENLLLPPWSNGLIPVFVFGVVWVSARIFQGSKDDRDGQGFNLFGMINIFILSVLYLIVFIILMWSTFFVQDITISASDLKKIIIALFVLATLPLVGGVFFQDGKIKIVFSLKAFTKLVWAVLSGIAVISIIYPTKDLTTSRFTLITLKSLMVGFILLFFPFSLKGLLWLIVLVYDFIPLSAEMIKSLERLLKTSIFQTSIMLIQAFLHPARSVKGLVAAKRAKETGSKEEWERVIKAFPLYLEAQVRLQEIRSNEIRTELRNISRKMGNASDTKNPALIDELLFRLNEFGENEEYRGLFVEQRDKKAKDLEQKREEIVAFISRFNWFILLNDYDYAYNEYQKIRAVSKTPYFIDDTGLLGNKGGEISAEDTDIAMHVKYLQWLEDEIQSFIEFFVKHKESFPEELEEKKMHLLDMIDNLSEKDRERFIWWRGLLVKSAKE